MNMAASASLPFDLAPVIENDVQRFMGLAERPHITATERIANPYSDVYRITLASPAGTRCAYLKVPHHTTQNEAVLKTRLKTEYEVMHTLANRWAADSQFGVIEPIAFYPEQPALLTNEATGRPLRARYRTTARLVGLAAPRKELIEGVRGCGQWLSAFQQATACGTAPFDVDSLIAYCEVRIRLLLEDATSGFSPDLAEKLMEQLHFFHSKPHLAQTLVCGRHNDFASHNIISNETTIRVIDFSMYDQGSAAYDLCNFWLELEMLKYDWTYSRDFLSELQRAFLEGFDDVDLGAPAFALARVRYSLNRLLTALSDRGRWRPDTRYRRRAAEVSLDWLRAFSNGRFTAE